MGIRTAISVLLSGAVLLLGSCAPFGISIYRSFFAEPESITPLQVGATGRSGPVQVPPGKLARVALRADIQSSSVQEVESKQEKTSHKPRYHFPASYTVTSGGAVLHSVKEPLAWDRGNRWITNDRTGSTGGTLTVEHSFDKFAAPASGAIEVEARVEPDSTFEAKINRLDLLVYGGLESLVPYVLAGIGLVLVGLLLAGAGLVFLLAAAASSTTAAAVQEVAAESKSRQRAVLCHLAGFLGYVIPLGSVIGPLVPWLVWRSNDTFVDSQGREAFNFQLSVLIYALLSIPLVFVLIGILLLIAIAVFQIVFMVVAALAASEGRAYRYPLTLRLVK